MNKFRKTTFLLVLAKFYFKITNFSCYRLGISMNSILNEYIEKEICKILYLIVTHFYIDISYTEILLIN